MSDLPAQSDEVAAQPTELEELRKLVKDFPLNDRDVPIIYDTNEIDLITYALTGDDGEDDSVTVLQRLVRALPGKTVYNLLEEAETAAQPQQANWNAIHDAQQRYLPLIKAAVDLIAQCHLQLETLPVPQCYGVPYGHINALREALQHVNKQAGL